MIKKLLLNLRFGFGKKLKEDLIKGYNQEIKFIRKQIQEGRLDKKAYQEAEKKFTQQLKKTDQQQKAEKIKNYILGTMKGKQEQKKQNLQFIPNFLQIRKLKFNDKNILLIGIQEQNEDHCIYIKKMAQKMNVKTIVTAISPDLPYFIRTQNSYTEQWQNFLKDPKEGKFYISTTPKTIQDLCLTGDMIKLVKNGMTKSRQFNQILYALLQYHEKWDMYLPNTLLTPFVTYGIQNIYFCDYPSLKQRQLWANSFQLQQLRQLFENYKINFKRQKLKNYDSRILFPKDIIRQKFRYMANIVKLVALKNDDVSFFICPSEYTQMFIQEWKTKTKLNNYLQYNTQKVLQNITFMQFIQKLVILDYICQPLIQKYFVKYKIFPYFAKHTIGGKQHIGKVFVLWQHFYLTYRKKLYDKGSINDQFKYDSKIG